MLAKMEIVNEIMSRVNFIRRDINEAIDMQMSTESLDLLDDSPYQAEIPFNRLLPYADRLDKEANDMLASIKSNFGKCVLMRDINHGCVYWSEILNKYITLYGLRFTKEEHIVLIKLYYELITIPNLQPSVVETFGKMLISLLKKKKTISPDELELQWEPLYKLCVPVIYRKPMQFSLHRYPIYLENILEALVSAVKIYFSPNATQEILDELRPKLCPLDQTVIYKTFRLLRWFLPVQLPVKHHSIGHQLWLHEFMNVWEVCHNQHHFGDELMRLVANLASKNIGYIDWNPYIPIMFTRLMRMLNLPVHYKKTSCQRNIMCHNVYLSAVGEWVASVLGDHSNAQVYLEKFLKTIETYFHPANYGSWLGKLEELFLKIIYHVVLRLHKERYAKKTWELQIPDSHKLTEANVDAFVNSMMPVAMTAVFNKLCSQNFCYALQYLAMMRPNLVIPNVLEKLYPTLGNDIEPHKLITAMTCMVSIARPLVQGTRYINKDYAFPDGPSQVLPLLFSSLEGIDQNDPSKWFATLKLISTYVMLIPIVDCSNPKAEATDEERMVCAETSRFEDFVLQFLDKIFVLIGSSKLEFVRMENQSNDGGKSHLELMAESSLYGVFTSLLLQTSEPIFVSALNKLRSFIMENTLETKISGNMVAVLCRAFSKVNSQVTIRALLPYLVEQILEGIGENEDALKEENLDNQVLYSLLLLTQVLNTQGDALLPHMDDIVKVLDKVTRLKSLQGHQLGCQALKSVLESLCTVEAIRLDKNLDDPDYPHWQEWGESINVKSAEIKWYVPGEHEIAAAQNLFSRYFLPAVKSIKNYICTKNSLSRDELQATLRIINSVIEGCDSVLPIWSERSLLTDDLYEFCVFEFKPAVGNECEIKMPDGSNVRQALVNIMTDLQNIMLENVEDDTKSMNFLILIWQNLSMNKMRNTLSLILRRRHFHLLKKTVQEKLVENKGYLPQLLLERVAIQHELRKSKIVNKFTETAKKIIENLFKLSVSQYSRIRITAQTILWAVVNDYPLAYRLLVPHILEILKQDTEVHHDAYKGVLYILIQNQASSLLTKSDWDVLEALLPSLVLAKPSEKPSIIRQQDFIISTLTKNFITTNIKLEVPESCTATASKLWEVGVMPPRSEPSYSVIQQGILRSLDQGKNNLKMYYGITTKLLNSMLEKDLHWRHRQMAMNFISAVIHPDHPLPAPVVRYFLNALINDSIDDRKLAWQMLFFILKQQKRKHPKIVVNVANQENDLKPGRRTDNEWLQYNYERRPMSAEQWDEPRFVHKPYVGYYMWPKKLEVYAPSSQQPCLEQNRKLNDQEKEIDTFFKNKQNVSKLIEYLCLEEKKGKDTFNYLRCMMFKGLFRNHGDAYLSNILPQLSEIVQDKQESTQCFAAELTCGLIRGSKHWPYNMTRDMWQSLLPIIKVVLNNLTEETLDNWAIAFATIFLNRDPNKLHWLIECLSEESNSESKTSFLECARLSILQSALMPLSWRMDEMLNKLLPRFESRLLQNPFENVRDQLSSMLVMVFHSNLKFNRREKDGEKGYPEIDNFVNRVYPRLELLLTDTNNKSSEYIEATRLLNTLCRWIINSIGTSHFGTISSFFKLYPIISHLENNETENEELARVCTKTLAILSETFILSEHVPAALQAIENLSRSASWSARSGSVQFLQVFLFHNMSTLLSDERWIGIIRSIVLRLLQDERVEVREKAAQVLNGMIHCTLVTDREALLEEFRQLAKTKLKNKKKEASDFSLTNAIRLRHAGVLGMCAFIQAHPYDIPKDIPPIFQYISEHFSDPEPIPATIRKTLNDFKRTHCDGWRGLQGLAQDLTEEQFALLQDLTVPPSYYA